MLPAGCLLFFFGWLWLRVDPALQFHAAGPLFFLEPRFLRACLQHDGGPLEFAAAGAAQFSQVSWLGAVWYTVLAAWIMVCARSFLAAITGAPVQAAALAPVFLLLLLHSRYDEPPWRVGLELSFGLGFAAAYARLTLRAGWVRLGVFGIVGALLGYGAGLAPLLLFATCAIVVESAVHRRHLAAAGFLVLTVGIMFAIVRLREATLKDAVMRWGGGSRFWLTALLYSFTPAAGLILRVIGPSGTTAPASGHSQPHGSTFDEWLGRLRTPKVHSAATVVGILAVGVALAWTFDAQRREAIRVDYLAEHGRWEEVLAVAPRVALFDAVLSLNVDRALFHTGRMGEDLFGFRQFRGRQLLPGLDQGLGVCRPLSHTLFELGHVGLAEHFSHEALEIEGERPDILLQLAWINALKGRPKAARIFLNRLDQNPSQHRLARHWLQALELDPSLSASPEVQRVRTLMSTIDSAQRDLPTESLLLELLQSNPRNRMAFEYLMTHYLLTLDLERLVANLARLDEVGMQTLPRHYQEAILIRQKNDAESALNLRGRQIDPGVAARFERFLSEWRRVGNRPESAAVSLAREFGDTYWYFYLTGKTFGRNAVLPQTTS